MMSSTLRRGLLLLALLPSTAALAQAHGLPLVGGVLGRVDGVVQDTLHTTAEIGQSVTTMATARVERLNQFVDAHRGTIERDDAGQPARAHEVLLLDPDAATLNTAADAGFALVDQGDVDGLQIAYARLRTPPGKSLPSAIRILRRQLPGSTVTSDTLHFPGGAASARAAADRPAPMPVPRDATVGIIDGGVQNAPRIAAQAGFALGAPHPNAHAQAIASLLAGAGVARVMVADVYGIDPAGGDALAIARALGWLQAHGTRVVSISLVGPANPLLARAIASVQARGMIVVAAVGNDGAAAPASFPASYPGVIAVTGVDGHNRVLFEAGHALHLDYAAPGADLTAIGLDGRSQRLRGTSFAAPLVAARIAALDFDGDAHAVLERADREALSPGPRTGRGILCNACRQGI